MPRFGERPAGRIDERERQDFFDELARDGLSHSRLANVKAVASSIYAWALHRTRLHVASNPLRYIPARVVALGGEQQRGHALLQQLRALHSPGAADATGDAPDRREEQLDKLTACRLVAALWCNDQRLLLLR